MTRTEITHINVYLQTGSGSDAGTDGDVYLGICGREFFLDTSVNDFEKNSARTYTLGQGSNSTQASTNDPRNPQLFLEDLDLYPAYIRFAPAGRSDRWQLAIAQVFFNGGTIPHFDAFFTSPNSGIWMGPRSGLITHLFKSG